jgi:uncharacterized protein with NRDE domain
MCLIAWRWQPDADVPLVVVANRDEFYARPTLAMHWWAGADILAGRDLHAGGSWLGLGRSGRFAAITNFRTPESPRNELRSRGELVTEFLQAQCTPSQYLSALTSRSEDYNPFNLLVSDGHQLMGLESRSKRGFLIEPGVGAVSNADFNTPWPKLHRLTQDLAQTSDPGAVDPSVLFEMLQRREVAKDEQLPHTGIALERERALSAAFIQTPEYGTRASTVVRQTRTGCEVWERRFDANGPAGELRFSY